MALRCAYTLRFVQKSVNIRRIECGRGLQPILNSAAGENAILILRRRFGRMWVRHYSFTAGPASMRFMAVILLVVECSLAGGLASAAAQSSTFQQGDGTIGILSPLGGHEAIYSDAHGNKGIIHQGSGLPSHTFSSPHGAPPRAVTPFGTPTPPNLLTPAPLLPIQPRGMATPQPQSPATSGLSSSSVSGRPGR